QARGPLAPLCTRHEHRCPGRAVRLAPALSRHGRPAIHVAAGIVEPDRRVTIVEPIGSWPAEFEAIADVLRRELGLLAVRIDHIGSTAVADLPAKDVIDLQVTVASLDRST